MENADLSAKIEELRKENQELVLKIKANEERM